MTTRLLLETIRVLLGIIGAISGAFALAAGFAWTLDSSSVSRGASGLVVAMALTAIAVGSWWLRRALGVVLARLPAEPGGATWQG